MDRPPAGKQAGMGQPIRYGLNHPSRLLTFLESSHTNALTLQPVPDIPRILPYHCFMPRRAIPIMQERFRKGFSQ